MGNNAKQPAKPTKPSPYPSAMPGDADRVAPDQEHGEGSYSGTRDYQARIKAYLETADVEKDARDAAPDNATEERELEEAEDAGRLSATKTKRTSKNK